MLNDYHRQFLHHLVFHRVRFLVVGGQARYLHQSASTRDLDIWADIEAPNIPALETALVTWSECHPMHTARPIVAPLTFRPGQQIKFPDADASFMEAGNHPAEILVSDGIDILSSIGTADFNACFSRAMVRLIDGAEVAFLSLDDLNTISPAKNDGHA